MYRMGEDGRLAGRERQLLTPEQVETVTRAILAGATQREAAELIGVRYSRLRARIADQIGIRVGRGRVRAGLRREWFRDLHPDEIWVRAAEVRRSWPIERWLQAVHRNP